MVNSFEEGAMNHRLAYLLTCPNCGRDICNLTCTACGIEFPCVGGIPRFVSSDNYAAGFGFEWTRHARTQYDSYSGLPLSRNRFFGTTRWPTDMSGQVVLEVGSGSGRFTEIVAATGADVVSVDYSVAVDANYASNGQKPNVLIVQGDIYNLPFRRGVFDKVFCFGTLQHTPDPYRALLALPPMLKPGGELVIDVYKRTLSTRLFHTKYVARLFTRRLDPERLYDTTRRYVDFMWPVCSMIRRIPRIGHSLNWRLLVPDYSPLGLHGALLKEWAYLDAFDMLSPRFDLPQKLTTVAEWFRRAGLVDITVEYGGTGLVGRGRVPAHI